MKVGIVVFLAILWFAGSAHSADVTIKTVVLSETLQPLRLACQKERYLAATKEGLVAFDCKKRSSLGLIWKTPPINDLAEKDGLLLVAHDKGATVEVEKTRRQFLVGKTYAIEKMNSTLLLARESDMMCIPLDGSPSYSERLPTYKDVYLSSLPRHICYAHGTLWVGTKFGLYGRTGSSQWHFYVGRILFQNSKGRSSFAKGSAGLCGNEIQSIRPFDAGVIISSSYGLTLAGEKWRLIEASQEIMAFDEGDIGMRWHKGNFSLPSNDVRDACFVGAVLAIGTKLGLLLTDSELGSSKLVGGLPDNEIVCLMPTIDGHLLVGSRRGLSLISFNSR